MFLTAEPAGTMGKSSNVHPGHPPQSRRKDRERGALVPPRSQRQRASKAGRLPEASVQTMENPETNEGKVEQKTEVKVKSTVVDIDSVRGVNEENLGLLEAAEQEDSKSKV